jgi:hypothetical protein
MENGGAAGTEETGVSMGYCVDEETSLNFESAAPLHVFTEPSRLTATNP